MSRKGVWIRSAYRELCRQLGPPENATEKKNLWEWAQAMVYSDCNYIEQGYSAKDAVWEEIQAGL